MRVKGKQQSSGSGARKGALQSVVPLGISEHMLLFSYQGTKVGHMTRMPHLAVYPVTGFQRWFS